MHAAQDCLKPSTAHEQVFLQDATKEFGLHTGNVADSGSNEAAAVLAAALNDAAAAQVA